MTKSAFFGMCFPLKSIVTPKAFLIINGGGYSQNGRDQNIDVFQSIRIVRRRGEFRGGRRRRIAPPQGFDPLPTQRVPLFFYFEIFDLFWQADPKIFLKAPLAPNILILRGRARRKNPIFWLKFSKKVPKNDFLASYSKFCLRCRNYGQSRHFLVL